jgi:hypothetical protein
MPTLTIRLLDMRLLPEFWKAQGFALQFCPSRAGEMICGILKNWESPIFSLALHPVA